MSPVNPETTNRASRKRRRATSRFCIGGNPWAGNQQRAAYVTCWNLRVNSITIPPESRSDLAQEDRASAEAYRLDSLGTTALHGDGEFAKSNSRGDSGLTTGPSHRYQKSEKLVALSRRGLALARRPGAPASLPASTACGGGARVTVGSGAKKKAPARGRGSKTPSRIQESITCTASGRIWPGGSPPSEPSGLPQWPSRSKQTRTPSQCCRGWRRPALPWRRSA